MWRAVARPSQAGRGGGGGGLVAGLCSQLVGQVGARLGERTAVASSSLARACASKHAHASVCVAAAVSMQTC